MDNTVSHLSSDPLNSINHKLDELLTSVASLSERQQVNDEIMVELIKFFQRFREETLEGQQVSIQELRSAAEAIIYKTNDLMQSSVKLTEAVAGGLKDIGTKSEQAAAEHYRVLRQLAQTNLRKLPVASGKIRSVFLVHMIESWDAQVDIYRAMRADDRFEPVVVSINRAFPGDNSYNGEDVVSRALTNLGIEHVRLGTQDFNEAQETLRFLAPDVIFRQSHWDRDYPPAFSTAELAFTRLCIVPYGMSIVQKFSHSEPLPTTISPMAFDQPYHRSAWRVFCETEQTKSYFLSFQHSDPSKFVLSGYPKHERLLRSIGHGQWPLPDTAENPYRVIWAPHHSVGNDWLAFGVFHNMYMDMLRWAQRAPHIQFVLKPHPALFALVVRMGLVSQANLDEFKRQWQALPNCTIFEGQYGELFAASDLMLTDGLSFLTEYQLFNKPLVFIDSRRHVQLNALGQLAVDCAESVNTLAEAESAVPAYAAGKPLERNDTRARLQNIMLPNERPSALVIVDAIAEGLGKERASAAA